MYALVKLIPDPRPHIHVYSTLMWVLSNTQGTPTNIMKVSLPSLRYRKEEMVDFAEKIRNSLVQYLSENLIIAQLINVQPL
jgi:hypothetical protein